MSRLSKVRAIAWREFRYTALTKAFLIGAVAFPLVMWIAFPLIIELTDDADPPLRGTLAVVDPTGEVVEAMRYEFDPARGAEAEQKRQEATMRVADEIRKDPSAAIAELKDDAEMLRSLTESGMVIEIAIEEVAPDADLGPYKTRVRADELVAVVDVDPRVIDVDALKSDDADDKPTIEIFAAENIHPSHSRKLRQKIGSAVLRVRAQRRGEDVEMLRAILKPPPFKTTALGEGDTERRDQADFKEVLPYMMLALLIVCAFTSGQYLLTTTIEEKSNKIMEVLLSATSPLELMTGKILGQALVGCVMLVTYGGLGLGALAAFATLDLIQPFQLVCFVLYFVMAYFFTAAAMASIGSAVSDIHDAQTLMLPAMVVLLFVPMLLMFPAGQNPSGLLARVAGFVPPVIPYVMMIRVTAGDVPLWEVILSMVIGYASVGGALWLASKIFRVGVLMYGKPPSPLEMLRWVRYS